MATRPLWKALGNHPWLTNPRLLLLNPRKGTNMATRRRRRRARRNPVANPITNRRRRRTYRHNPVAANPRRRRRARRNPPNGGERGLRLAGVTLPGLQTAAFATGGFILPPIIESYLRPMLPANISTTAWGKYLLKFGTVFGLTWGARAFAGSSAAYKVGIGGMVYLSASIVRDFMPNLVGTTAAPAVAYYPRLASQPLLGDYMRNSNITATTPSRLQPQSRY